jgi:hypothetical protein
VQSWRFGMPSVVRLLEEREAARRVEVLREEADRVLAGLREAELAWERFVTAREAVVEVLTAPDVAVDGGEVAVAVTEDAVPTPTRGCGAGVGGAHVA